MKNVFFLLFALSATLYCQAQVKRTVTKSNMVVTAPYEQSLEKQLESDVWVADTLMRQDERGMKLNRNYNTGQTYTGGTRRPPLQGYKQSGK